MTREAAALRAARKALAKPSEKRLRKAVEAFVRAATASDDAALGDDDDGCVAAATALLLDADEPHATTDADPVTAAKPVDDFAAWYAARLAVTFASDVEAMRASAPDEISRLAWALRSVAESQDAVLPRSVKEALRRAF